MPKPLTAGAAKHSIPTYFLLDFLLDQTAEEPDLGDLELIVELVCPNACGRLSFTTTRATDCQIGIASQLLTRKAMNGHHSRGNDSLTERSFPLPPDFRLTSCIVASTHIRREGQLKSKCSDVCRADNPNLIHSKCESSLAMSVRSSHDRRVLVIIILPVLGVVIFHATSSADIFLRASR